MSIRFLSCAGLIMISLPAWGWASHQGRGQVDFNGEIVEVPCNIDTNSRDQTLSYGVVSAKSNGLQSHKAFDIKLVDCTLASQNKPGYVYRKASIVFYGQPDPYDSSLLGVSGSAEGLGIKLLNHNQQHIVLGETHNDYELVNGDNSIHFFTELKFNQQPLKAGEFQALLQFVVSYF
ncbi:MAG: type 1 fimbrial protein [Neisseriaceae bacterium]|nr:type 1 fimbrial protein [Neisseriaceae bacterium]